MKPEWYYAKGKQCIGPLMLADLRRLINSGELKPKDMVFADGWKQWQPAAGIPGLFPAESPFQTNGTTVSATLPPETCCPEAEWYYMKGQQRFGPILLAELQRMVASDQVERADMVWRQGSPRWMAASTFPELTPHFREGQQSAPTTFPSTVLAPRHWKTTPAYYGFVAFICFIIAVAVCIVIIQIPNLFPKRWPERSETQVKIDQLEMSIDSLRNSTNRLHAEVQDLNQRVKALEPRAGLFPLRP